MANDKLNKEAQKAFEKGYEICPQDWLRLTENEREDLRRFNTEIEWIERFFIPVNFEIANNKDLQGKPEYELQRDFLAFNYDTIKRLMETEEENKKKVFKYVSYKQMADIYVLGKKKVKVNFVKNKKGEFFNSLTFADLSREYEAYKNKLMEMAQKRWNNGDKKEQKNEQERK